MAGSLNKVTLIGNLGADPEIRDLPGGSRVANFSIATTESWRDKNSGEKKERTEWHRLSVFNDSLVDVIEKYVHKGDKIYVEGELQTEKYWRRGDEQNDDNARYATKVVLTGFGGKLVMLGSPGGGQGRDPNDNASRAGNGGQGYREARDGEGQRSRPPVSSGNGGERGYGRQSSHLDDDIPFAPEFR